MKRFTSVLMIAGLLATAAYAADDDDDNSRSTASSSTGDFVASRACSIGVRAAGAAAGTAIGEAGAGGFIGGVIGGVLAPTSTAPPELDEVPYAEPPDHD